MTEAEWLMCQDPWELHQVAAQDALQFGWPHMERTKRKRAFFGAACCRLVWPLIASDDRCRRWVEFLETQFDLGLPEHELKALKDELENGIYEASENPAEGTPWLQEAAARLAEEAACGNNTAIGYVVRSLEEWGDPKERAVQIAHIIRDIVGNPFRTVVCDPEWRTSTVLALAQGIYQERVFDRMPILADALQDAGCNNDDILNHCRGEGPHVRGCWVVDLVLGKE